ncbi:MAG: hypothetical protein IKP46_05170 [Bacteroidales bacterium]|nr:hypothetical protein [Bacteroidales bacterium]
MKKFFAIAAIALLCVPAFVSCKKDNKGGDKTPSTNFLSFGGQQKTVVSAEYLGDDPDEYYLIIQLEDGITFEFELAKGNKGKKIDLLQPDPLASKAVTETVETVYYSVLVYNAMDWSSRRELANGNPKSTLPTSLGEGSYMQIDGEGDDIVLDFELRNCNFSTPFEANNITIAGHYKGFERYVAPPK